MSTVADCVNRKRAKPSQPNTPKGDTLTRSTPVRLIGGDYEIVARWPMIVLSLFTLLLTLPLFAPWSFWPVA